MRIENEELAKKGMKTQVMTYEGERDVTMSSNKLINNTTTEQDEKTSACSCNCMGTSSGNTDNGQLLIDGYLPTDLVTSSLSLKRASV